MRMRSKGDKDCALIHGDGGDRLLRALKVPMPSRLRQPARHHAVAEAHLLQ